VPKPKFVMARDRLIEKIGHPLVRRAWSVRRPIVKVEEPDASLWRIIKLWRIINCGAIIKRGGSFKTVADHQTVRIIKLWRIINCGGFINCGGHQTVGD